MMFLGFLRRAIHFSTAYLYGATGEIITEKSGHLNLGIPGIMCMGAVGGCLFDVAYMQKFDDPSLMNPGAVIVLGLLGAIIFGALMGMLYSFFADTLRCNQNVTGLTITTFGVGVMKFWRMGMSEKEISLYYVRQCFAKTFPCADTIGDFGRLFFSYGTLVYLAIALAIIATIVLKKTRIGLNLRAVGENPAAADAVGINVTRYKYLSTTIGCAISAIGGLFCIMEVTTSFTYPVDAVGWLAVALVIFSVWNPSIGILGSIVFAMLYYAPQSLASSGVDANLMEMLPYIATIIVLIVISMINKRETQPPSALGLSYFREDR